MIHNVLYLKLQTWGEKMFLAGGIVATLVGIVVLVLSIRGSKKYVSKKQRCTSVVDGTLIRFEKKEYLNNDKDNQKNYPEIYYYPVYEYIVDGERYEVQSSFGKQKEDMTLLGVRKQIFYNADNCSECYIIGEDMKKAYKVINAVGIILLIVGVVNFLLFFLAK